MDRAEHIPAPDTGALFEASVQGDILLETLLIDETHPWVTPQRDTLPSSSHLRDVDVLRHRGRALVSFLEDSIEKPPSVDGLTQAQRAGLPKLPLLQDISRGDIEAQAQHGIDFRELRLDILAHAAMTGRPIELQVALHAFNRPIEAWSRNGYEAGTQHEDLAAAGVGRVLRGIAANAGGHLRTNALVLYDPGFMSDGEGKEEFDLTVRHLLSQGIIRGDDVVGRDVYLNLMKQTDASQLEPLVARLRESSCGYIGSPLDPNDPDTPSALTSFIPHTGYTQYLAHLTDLPPAYLAKVGIPLLLANYTTDSAALALDSLTKNTQALRVTVEAIPDRSQYRIGNALARIAGSASIALWQVIYHNDRKGAGVLMERAFAAALLPHVRQLVENLSRFDNPENYDAVHYFEENYQAPQIQQEQRQEGAKAVIEGMLNEDYYCRTMMVNELHKRGIMPGQFKTMYDGFCGPAASLARIFAPYIAEKRHGGSITLVDVSPSSIVFQQRWINGTLDPKDAKVAELDQQLFTMTPAEPLYTRVYQEGRRETADDRARKLAKTRLGDFDHLEPESCDVLTDGYGTCSSGRRLIDGEVDPIPPTYEDFCHKQTQKFAALRPGGIAASMHMVRRTNWKGIRTDSGKPIDLPSIYLRSKREIEQAYMDAGFIHVYCEIVTVENPHHENVSATGDQPVKTPTAEPVAMAVVVAEKPKQAEYQLAHSLTHRAKLIYT